VCFLPAVSSAALKRMRQVVRDWRIHQRTSLTLENLAQQCNPIIQGWWNYYGAFYQRSMLELFHYVDNKLEQWARRKYKTLSQDKRRGGQWLRKMKVVTPRMREQHAYLSTVEYEELTQRANRPDAPMRRGERA
jgi:RNA-directed DNA polymerase